MRCSVCLRVFAWDLSWDVVRCVYVWGVWFVLVCASVLCCCFNVFVGGVFGLLRDAVLFVCIFWLMCCVRAFALRNDCVSVCVSFVFYGVMLCFDALLV